VRRLLCKIAGVDPGALEECPRTDSIWAAQLGLSLVLNFLLVFGLTLYSVGYFLPELPTRVLVALVVAAVLVMFDRALFQFDWFTIALLQEVQELNPHRATRFQDFLAIARPFWRLALRLMISLAIAYTLSVFVELAAFDSAIRERLTAENYVENTAYRAQLAVFDRGLDQQRAALTKRIGLLEDEIEAVQKGRAHAEQDDYDLLRRSAAEARTRITGLEETVAANEKRIRDLDEDIYSERYGLKDKPYRTGKPGCEPGGVCYDMVLTVKGLHEANATLRKDSEELRARIQELDDKASDALQRRNASDRGLIASRHQEIEKLQAEAGALESRKPVLVSAYEAELRRDGTYRPLLDDPMIRIRVLDELRRDPVKGPAITSMSLLIRAFIAFLELAPVLAKIFFAPPTVYSARIRAAVAIGQHRALRDIAEHLSAPAIGDVRSYRFDSMKVGAIEHQPAARAEQLGDSPPKALAISTASDSATKALPSFSLDDFNQFVVPRLTEWVAADPQHKQSAGDYYTAKLAQGQILGEPDRAIVSYSRERFGRQTRFFELGVGFGELSLALALSGFRTVGFESDAGRYAGASALAVPLAQQGIDPGNLSLVYGLYPDVFRLDGPQLDNESVFVSTNTTSSLMMEAIERVLRSLRHFDHLIIDLSRFGEVRDVPSQLALVAKLHDLGFQETEQVFASGDTDIRHFQRNARGMTGSRMGVGYEPR
jgi:hypothetical protein